MSYAVSIVLPVYNGASYLTEAINSILCQTFSNFELIIINDCSVDDTEKIIKYYSDPRIKYLKNDSNLGLIETLNKGLAYCTGEFIARMDADDISLPNRLQSQLDYMVNNPNVGICGAWIKVFGPVESFIRKLPASNDEIKMELLFRSPIAHPAVMIRRSVIEGFSEVYDKNFIAAEDYELWSRLSLKTELHNIQNVLLDYRVHASQVTTTMVESKEQTRKEVHKKILTSIGIEVSQNQLDLHYAISESNKGAVLFKQEDAENWLTLLKENCLSINYAKADVVAKIICTYWISFMAANGSGFKGIVRALSSPLVSIRFLKSKDLIRLIAKQLFYSPNTKSN